jgi:hypothetical protein
MEEEDIEQIVRSIIDSHPVHIEIPLEDLRDCIIEEDIGSLDPKWAGEFLHWLDLWKEKGLSDEQTVDLFFHVLYYVIAKAECKDMMEEISEFLDNG